MSPAAAVVEEVAAGWLLELFGLPKTASTGFVTGCGMANFTALAAARHELLRRAGWDVEADGLQHAPKLRVIVGDEVHVSAIAALRLIGIGSRQVQRVTVDDQGRMKADALERALATGDQPTIVCAQAGNVNTGAFDPLDAIADVTSRHRAWLHVDGAFGLWAAASAALNHHTRGVERADSWATDAHKWLNVPHDSASSSSRIRGASRRDEHERRISSPLGRRAARAMDWTPEASRRARGFAVRCAAIARPARRRGFDRSLLPARASLCGSTRREPGIRFSTTSS
jgi:glutamate/tyrosine decarboxylase-like PLP-dependent enzyme